MSAWMRARSLAGCLGVVAASILAQGAPDGPATSLLVPRRTPVALDGTLAAGEWEDATIVPTSDALTLFFKYADGSLWLGIRAPEMGVVNVLVLDQGDVKVLHSSAALGTARYTPDGDVWRLTQSFVWRCRAIDMSDAAIAERRAFFESERWLASTAYMGSPGDLELQLAWDGQPLQLALLWLPVSNPRNVTAWPEAVPRDTLPAPIPAVARFATSEWATLVLEPSPPTALAPYPTPGPDGAAPGSRPGGRISRTTASAVPASERGAS